MANEFMLSTIDNPYDPFEEFTLWLLFDNEKGYYTCERLMRKVEIREDMTQQEIDEATDRAMDELIADDILGVFVKVAPRTVAN